MDRVSIFAIGLALINFALIYGLNKLHEAHEARIKALEAKREQERRVVAPVQEKPVVQGAKEVKPLQIGEGRLNFDIENQIAEWA